MNTLQNIEDIFSGFHDGTIESHSGNKSRLTLKISCSYLAEQIDKTFEYFYVELIELKKLELFTWKSLNETDQKTITEIDEIFRGEFEIIDANKETNEVIILGNIDNKNLKYCGGNLMLNCNEIKVYDQNKRQLTIEEFGKMCRQYWQNFDK